MLDGTLITEPAGFLTGLGWETFPSCCVGYDTKLSARLNDEEFIGRLAETIRDEPLLQADPNRLHLSGFSNGAFLSMLMLEKRGDLFASAAVYAGSIWDHDDWEAEFPVSFLAAHGTNDSTVRYSGGNILANYPSVDNFLASWADKLGIDGNLQSTGETLDVNGNVAGEETTVFRYTDASENANERRPIIEHWKVEGGEHFPIPRNLDNTFNALTERFVDFMLENPKIQTLAQ